MPPGMRGGLRGARAKTNTSFGRLFRVVSAAMRTIPLWLALVACGGMETTNKPPAPYVTALTPSSGPWGSIVTITGANFGEVVSPTNVVSFAGGIGANGFVVETWH